MRTALAGEASQVPTIPGSMRWTSCSPLQDHYGYLTRRGRGRGRRTAGHDPLEVEELATFYPFIYRRAGGRYVIHVCDSVVCWMDGHESLQDYLCANAGDRLGETTADGLFTLLPVCCIGYCDRAPAMLVNRKVYGHLTPEKLDDHPARLRPAGGRMDRGR